MRSKSFGERIADVLIEDGLLLPNQLDEAINLQKQQGGRLLKILTDKQFVTDQDMAFSDGPLPEYAADQSLESAGAGGDPRSRPARHGEDAQAHPDRASR